MEFKYKCYGVGSIAEIAFAITVMAILLLGLTLNLSPFLTGGKMSNTNASLTALTTAVSEYKYDHDDDLPDDLDSLSERDEQYGPYIISQTLKDSWGRGYQYQKWKSNTAVQKADTFAIWSKGPDGSGSFNQSLGTFSNGAVGFVSK